MPTTVTAQDYDDALRYIAADANREVELAKATADPTRAAHLTSAGVPLGAGNLLTALGLLCYTEFCGWLEHDRRHQNGQVNCAANFHDFFVSLGRSYAALRPAHNIYNVFRCGMAHNYFAKQDFEVDMIEGGAGAGVILVGATNKFHLVVETYARDLLREMNLLRGRLAFPIIRA
jgi:hypothetical protein